MNIAEICRTRKNNFIVANVVQHVKIIPRGLKPAKLCVARVIEVQKTSATDCSACAIVAHACHLTKLAKVQQWIGSVRGSDTRLQCPGISVFMIIVMQTMN
jgi:hypothetical protein